MRKGDAPREWEVRYLSVLSYHGDGSRLNYLVFGVVLFYGLLWGGLYIGALSESMTVLLLFVLSAIAMATAATVRRAKEIGMNPWVTVALWTIPYVGMAVTLGLLLISKRT